MMIADKLNELIAGIEFAMLSTVHANEQIHSRPMATQAVTADGCLWFFTSQNSSKIDDLHNNRQVNVSYADPANMRFVSISGTCEPIRSHPMAQQLWKPAYERWFARGVDDPDLLLLKVTINAAEYWDASANRMRSLEEHDTVQLRDERAIRVA